MQAVFIRAVWLGRRGLHWDLVLIAVRDQLGAAWKPRAESLHTPRSNNSDFRVKCFGGQLKPTLIVALPGGAVGVSVGLNFASYLQTDFGNERAGNRSSQEIDGFVLRLPLQHRKSEIATELVLSIHD